MLTAGTDEADKARIQISDSETELIKYKLNELENEPKSEQDSSAKHRTRMALFKINIDAIRVGLDCVAERATLCG